MRAVFLVIAAGCTALILESLLAEFINWMLVPGSVKRITLIPIGGGCDDIERRLRWQLFKFETELIASDRALLIVDCGACSEGIEIAQKLCRGRKNCRVCKASELNAILGCDAVCKGIELVLY